jgi:hypothetical protein
MIECLSGSSSPRCTDRLVDESFEAGVWTLFGEVLYEFSIAASARESVDVDIVDVFRTLNSGVDLKVQSWPFPAQYLPK